MSNYKLIVLFFIVALQQSFSQEKKEEVLDEIVITSERIDLPFSKNSRTIQIITAKKIAKSTATNITDLLQNVAGIDIRRRGIDGMQSDIYIRGGHFNQTLILIDGIKVEDLQTGHHTMNVMIPIENIERIEIVKGPAARVFGQNAFSGAINIVTKTNIKKHLTLNVNSGSYSRLFYGITAAAKMNKSSHQIHISRNTSDGYIDNTDFKNQNYFLKSSFATNKNPINVLASFGERKFGANNFYTNTPAFNEYEETQTSIVGISTKITTNNWVVKPNIYWKRNQDMFLLKRENPSFSRNFNISNKIGAQINTSYTSTLGITGFGVDIAAITLRSNNLGDQNRTMATAFVEHRFQLLNNTLDITPGVSLNYFSDFNFNAFPGIDIGYSINQYFKIYGNIGYSYRVPTYTELYINIPNFLSGNSSLQPEKALAEEIGISYRKENFSINSAIFYRNATDLIDYVKETSASTLFEAKNLRNTITKGFEITSDYSFKVQGNTQNITLGYTFIDENYPNVTVFASRYLLNSAIKHQLSLGAQFSILNILKPSFSYRFVERPTQSYHLLDARVNLEHKNIQYFLLLNNVTNTVYSEKTNVLMPKRNLVFGVNYRFY